MVIIMIPANESVTLIPRRRKEATEKENGTQCLLLPLLLGWSCSHHMDSCTMALLHDTFFLIWDPVPLQK
jgi:hypothetical protein